MKISVFAHTANPLTDRPMVRKSRSYVKNLLDTLAARIIDGKTPEDTCAIQLHAPINRMERANTLTEERLGWNMPPSRLQDSAVNRGRSGQFSIGYDIPYVFEGHLKSPRAYDVNRSDAKPA